MGLHPRTLYTAMLKFLVLASLAAVCLAAPHKKSVVDYAPKKSVLQEYHPKKSVVDYVPKKSVVHHEYHPKSVKSVDPYPAGPFYGHHGYLGYGYAGFPYGHHGYGFPYNYNGFPYNYKYPAGSIPVQK